MPGRGVQKSSLRRPACTKRSAASSALLSERRGDAFMAATAEARWRCRSARLAFRTKVVFRMKIARDEIVFGDLLPP